MNFNGLNLSHKHSWILCWAIKFKGWRNSKSGHREISASLSQPIRKKKRKKNNSLPVPGRDAEGFCHLLSSTAPLKSFTCAEKETKIKTCSLWRLTDNNSGHRSQGVIWALACTAFLSTVMSSAVTRCKMKMRGGFFKVLSGLKASRITEVDCIRMTSPTKSREWRQSPGLLLVLQWFDGKAHGRSTKRKTGKERRISSLELSEPGHRGLHKKMRRIGQYTWFHFGFPYASF